MLVAVPKLKLMGLIRFFAVTLQLAALSSPWFMLYDTSFSIKAVSNSYIIDMMQSSCSTFENFQGFKCYCNTNCVVLRDIYNNGWACALIVIISINCFITEIVTIRRKIWRCEGNPIPYNFIDNDFFILVGTIVLTFSIFLWFWQIFKIKQNMPEIYLVGGANTIIVAFIMHVGATLYYFIKIKSDTRMREQ